MSEFRFRHVLYRYFFKLMFFTTHMFSSLSAVQAFNASNRWVKRGLSLTPVKYGFELAGNAHAVLINVNALDGTGKILLY